MIDPEFWSDEEIGQWSTACRLFYIGLWNFSDDEGRFKAHDALLRSQIFPYDTKINIGKLKKEISAKIQWYEVEGSKYGYIRNFLKHQRIDRPQPSKLPEPPEFDERSTINHGLVPPNLKEDNIREINIREGKGETNEIQTVLSQWNSFAKEIGLETIIKLTDKRKKAIYKRTQEFDFDLQKIFRHIKESNFLQGHNDRGWKVDFDFVFCSENNYLKILENKYGNNSKNNRATANDLAELTAQRYKGEHGG